MVGWDGDPRDHFLSLGGFNENMDLCEDMDLCVKMFYGIDGDSSDSDRTSLRQVRRVPRRQRQLQGGTLAQIEGRAETSGRRVAEWGALRSLQVYLVLSLSYAFGASPRALNQLARREYTEVRRGEGRPQREPRAWWWWWWSRTLLYKKIGYKTKT